MLDPSLLEREHERIDAVVRLLGPFLRRRAAGAGPVAPTHAPRIDPSADELTDTPRSRWRFRGPGG